MTRAETANGRGGAPSLSIGRVAAAALVVAAVSWPAWSGGWVYDDWLMRGNDTMDGAEDLAAAFSRTSSDYFHVGADRELSGATYRPLSMLSLIAVQAVSQDAPLAHHLISLALHLGCLLLLWSTLRARTGSTLALALTLVAGLHPAAIEAYGWINGRSDVLAGLGLVLLAWCSRGAAPGARTRVLAAVAGAAALLSKETALPAVLGLLVAELLPARGLPTRSLLRERWAPVAAGALGIAGAVGLRALSVGLTTAGAGTLALERGLALGVARVAAKSLVSLVVPLPRTMVTLAWELSRPWSWTEMVLLALAGAVLVALLVRRRFHSVALLLAALACLVPAIAVRHAFWHGFDRYLYMPTLLGCLAAAQAGLPSLESWPARTRGMALGALALALGVAASLTAGSYASQADHLTIRLEQQPEDPSGYLMGARWLWNADRREDAEQLLARMPDRDLPPPIASELATLLNDMGRREEALEVVGRMEARYPDDPWVLFDVVSVRLVEHDLGAALAAAGRLRALPSFCRGVHVLLERAEAGAAEGDRRRLRSWRRSHACG